MQMSNIFSFINKIMPSFNKSDLETDLEVSISYINEAVLPTYKDLESLYSVNDIISTKGKKIVTDFYKELSIKDSKVKITPQKNIGKDIYTLISNVGLNALYVQVEFKKFLSNTVITSNLTAKKAFYLRAIGHIYFMSKYATDLANYLYINETLVVQKDLDTSYKLAPKQEKYIVDNIWVFARLLSTYGLSNENFKDKIYTLSDVVIPTEVTEDTGMHTGPEVDIIDNISTNFIGSPIYQIRLVFAQWEADRYKDLKDKKKLLELRALYFRLLKEKGQADATIEKELEYLQKRVTDLDYKISKMEESVND